MVRITLYVGQTDQHGQPMQAVAQQWDEAQRLFLVAYGGFTMQAVTGGWYSALQEKVQFETTVLVSIITEDDDRVKLERVVKAVKELFQQEKVLYTIEAVEGAFV